MNVVIVFEEINDAKVSRDPGYMVCHFVLTKETKEEKLKEYLHEKLVDVAKRVEKHWNDLGCHTPGVDYTYLVSLLVKEIFNEEIRTISYGNLDPNNNVLTLIKLPEAEKL